MTRYFSILVWVLVLVVLFHGHAAAWEGTVVKVIDGDSLKVKSKGRIYEIRLYGIDTPEYNQPYSNKAKQLTSRLALGEVVSVEKKDIDRYDRIVALVSCRGQLVNRELVRAGLAWYYPRYCRDQPLCDELKRLELEARKQQRGLWHDAAPLAPWEWKRKERSRDSEGQSGWFDGIFKGL